MPSFPGRYEMIVISSYSDVTTQIRQQSTQYCTLLFNRFLKHGINKVQKYKIIDTLFSVIDVKMSDFVIIINVAIFMLIVFVKVPT